MINEVINIRKDTQSLCSAFTDFLMDLVSQKDQINMSLSGGSTPKVLFNYWAENYYSWAAWKKINFFWGDERCVAPDDPMSNFGVAKQLLFDKAHIPGNNIFRIHGENEASDEAELYSNILDSHLSKEKGIPFFDILMLGLGDDGHTASIFPNQMQLWKSTKYCVVAEHPDSKMQRISITGQIINKSQNIAFLVTGKNKSQKVKDIILHRKQFYDIYPAARVNPINGNLYWFLDEEAASLL